VETLPDISPSVEEGTEDVLHFTDYDRLLKKIAAHPELSTAPKAKVEQAIELALNRHRAGYQTLSPSEHQQYREAFAADSIHSVQRAYKDLIASDSAGKKSINDTTHDTPGLRNYRAKKLSPSSSRSGGGSSATNESMSFVQRITQQWETLSPEAKVHTSASYAMAGLLVASAFGNVSAGLNGHDENGVPRVGVSHIVIGCIMALLGVSAALAGNKLLEGAAR
jgi:hypothetical protein